MSPKSLSADLFDDCESGLGLRFFTEVPTESSWAFSSTLLCCLASGAGCWREAGCEFCDTCFYNEDTFTLLPKLT